MGNLFLLQACLKINKKYIPDPLEIGKKYSFTKKEHRIYQIKVPMDLRDENWNALGRCVITEYTIGDGKTIGTFIMVKLFNKEQSKHITDTFVSDEKVDAVLAQIK
jgi:hypothetical protein